jgi:hypothetical protein
MKTPRSDAIELKYCKLGSKEHTNWANELRQFELEIQAVADLIWSTRWASDDDHYQKMVGIAAEIRSGNYETLTALTKAK